MSKLQWAVYDRPIPSNTAQRTDLLCDREYFQTLFSGSIASFMKVTGNLLALVSALIAAAGLIIGESDSTRPRSRRSINESWRFTRNDPANNTVGPYAASKSWVLPTGNSFLKDTSKRVERPS